VKKAEKVEASGERKPTLTKRDDSKTQMRHKTSAAKQAKLVPVQANKAGVENN
jgi:hypothetical protein